MTEFREAKLVWEVLGTGVEVDEVDEVDEVKGSSDESWPIQGIYSGGDGGGEPGGSEGEGEHE